jgi:hypothetical protein
MKYTIRLPYAVNNEDNLGASGLDGGFALFTLCYCIRLGAGRAAEAPIAKLSHAPRKGKVGSWVGPLATEMVGLYS